MKKIVLTFGLISGAILSGFAILMIPLCMNRSLDNAEVIGYTVMTLAFILVFFAIRSYRDSVGGGVISFGKALQVGLLTTLVAGCLYVVSWEIVYFNFVPDFADKFAAHTIDKMRTKGATPAAIEKTQKDMDQFKELYKNPFIVAGWTFLEVLPVGLIVSLVSAGILRRKTPPTAPSGAAVAAAS